MFIIFTFSYHIFAYQNIENFTLASLFLFISYILLIQIED